MNGSSVLQSALQKWAGKQGNSISIVETDSGKKITYRELLSAIVSFQKFLGNDPQTIIIATHGGIINIVVWLTALMYGHMLIPISPNTTDFEYEELLNKYTPTLLISETETWITETHTTQLSLTEVEQAIQKGEKDADAFKQNDTSKDGIVYLETSGFTGEPKGMILTASQIVITAENILKVHELTENDRGLTPIPFFHVNAPVVSMVTSVLAGSTVIIAPKFSASHFWEWVEKYDPTWINIVPTIIAILLKGDTPSFLPKSLRFVRTASAPLPKANLLKFEAKFGIPVIETYGISEGASTIFANPLPPKKHKPGSVGLPLKLETKIVDPKTGKEVPHEEVGEIWVKGPQIIDHYEEGKGTDSFKNGWFITGDLGYFDEDGYLFLTGRDKEIIIRGGENIFPREIEEILLTYPKIDDVAVVGQTDSILGEKVVAFIVSTDKNNKNLGEDIKTFAATKLSPQKVPAEIYLLDQLPKGKTGKIDKKRLKTYTE